MPPLKKAPGIEAQAQSESTTMIQDKPEDVKMRSVEEIRAEIDSLQGEFETLHGLSDRIGPGAANRVSARLWALKWVLMEEV